MRKIFGAIVDFVVGTLILIALLVLAVVLFPITTVFLLLAMCYGIGKVFNWIRNVDVNEELDTLQKDLKELEEETEELIELLSDTTTPSPDLGQDSTTGCDVEQI